MKYHELSGIDKLRRMVDNFDSNHEEFNTRFTVEQLVIIHDAWMKSDWDINPDQWTKRQVQEALKGVPPNWIGDGKALYGEKALYADGTTEEDE